MTQRILVLLSERGYWGEVLVGPLETFDAKGYDVTFITPTGQRPEALPPSMDAKYIDTPPYPLEFTLRDATAPDGEYIGNVSRVRSVIVDYPFITSRSTPNSYLCGEKMVEVLEQGLTRWGW